MADGKQQAASFARRITVNVRGQYLIYLPEGYSKSENTWPLVLFLHGAEERGSTVEAVKKHGPPKRVEEGMAFPFILVSPQCPTDESWQVTVLRALLEEIEECYRVDKTREYVTGLSMGGFGTWRLAIAMPQRFAAIAPICGGGDSNAVGVLKNVPVWAFHGSKDRIVPIARSENTVQALKAAGGDVRFTVYPGVGHDSWTQTYEDPEFYSWLLSHQLPQSI